MADKSNEAARSACVATVAGLVLSVFLLGGLIFIWRTDQRTNTLSQSKQLAIQCSELERARLQEDHCFQRCLIDIFEANRIVSRTTADKGGSAYQVQNDLRPFIRQLVTDIADTRAAHRDFQRKFDLANAALLKIKSNPVELKRNQGQIADAQQYIEAQGQVILPQVVSMLPDMEALLPAMQQVSDGMAVRSLLHTEIDNLYKHWRQRGLIVQP